MIVAAFVITMLIAVERSAVLLVVLAVPLAVTPLRAVYQGAKGPALIPVLGATGKLQIVYGLTVTVGLIAS